jgi:hypothetical protein
MFMCFVCVEVLWRAEDAAEWQWNLIFQFYARIERVYIYIYICIYMYIYSA